ncbi:DUF5060 domain-containing protein, partial [Candidatus Poribacteria bacterium]|nr:DUF5060 domain-containing protein [Candidatus Poribacteria bacterium]
MAKHTIQRYHIYDFSLKSAAQHDNPFSVQLSATFENESGEKIENLPGFYDGDGWKIRFSPTCEGVWHGRTSSDHPALNNIVLDDIECVPNENANLHGVLQIDPQHRQKFSFSDATPFVPLGFECDWLFSYHQADAERCHRHIDLIAEHGFNYIVTNLYAHTGFSTRQNSDERPVDPAYIFSPPAMYPFGGSNDEPNHSTLNVVFFADFDRLMRYLHNRGIVVHLMIQVQNKSVRWPARRSPEDDVFWRYVVARYQAFCNLVWDVG